MSNTVKSSDRAVFGLPPPKARVDPRLPNEVRRPIGEQEKQWVSRPLLGALTSKALEYKRRRGDDDTPSGITTALEQAERAATQTIKYKVDDAFTAEKIEAHGDATREWFLSSNIIISTIQK